MSLEFGKTTFKELTLGLELTEKWLQQNGVDTAGTRFEIIKGYVNEIALHQEQKRTSEIIDRLGNQLIIASLTDAVPFIDIYNSFKGLKSEEIPRTSLKRSVLGSLLVKDEDAVTNQARNALFELELAALLQSKGIDIVNFDDISFELEKAIWNIQCKRPMSIKSLGSNIQEAISQSQKFFDKCEPSLDCRAIVAISLDKVLGFDKDIIIKTATGISLESYVQKRSKEFVDWFSGYRIIDPRILAVFAFFKGVAQLDEIGSLSTVKYTTVIQLVSNTIIETTDYSRMGSLAGMLK